MRHFPIFLALSGRAIVVSGAGETAVAKLRLILKTEALVSVFGEDPHPDVLSWARDGRLALHARPVAAADVTGAALVYAANDEAREDGRVAEIARGAGVLYNIVDNLAESQFITPAIVDRDPVTIAIGTEGTAPVLARGIKARIEGMLPATLGPLAKLAEAFRPKADELPTGSPRRRFWSRFFFEAGPSAWSKGGPDAADAALLALFEEAGRAETGQGRVSIVGAGPGDPDLLTRKALKHLHEADVVIHDRLVSAEILELIRREAIRIEAGKTGFGTSWKQEDINAEMIAQARAGHHVVRLKGGDPALFGRLDEETAALRAADVPFDVVPGITAASGAASALGLSLTRRGRNSALRYLTGHDLAGFAEQDWKSLARPGETAAIYMGKRAARFISGRLLMHGASVETPVTIVLNATRVDQEVIATDLGSLPSALPNTSAPAILLYGIEQAEAGVALADAAKQGQSR